MFNIFFFFFFFFFFLKKKKIYIYFLIAKPLQYRPHIYNIRNTAEVAIPCH